VPAVINRVSAKPLRHQDLVSTFSGGMARRLEIAHGMLRIPTTTRNLRPVSNQDL
jgi:ABC-type multidrug transport system ATPase subunit